MSENMCEGESEGSVRDCHYVMWSGDAPGVASFRATQGANGAWVTASGLATHPDYYEDTPVEAVRQAIRGCAQSHDDASYSLERARERMRAARGDIDALGVLLERLVDTPVDMTDGEVHGDT